MQILAISDTHGSYLALEQAILPHPDIDMIVHCGDGETELNRFITVHPEFAERVWHVRGNCDPTQHSPRLLVLDLPHGHRLAAVHGHEYMTGDLTVNLARLGHSQSCDLVLFGHTHRRTDTTVDGIRIFNPGSAARPRDGKPPSFGLIDVYPEGFLTSHGDLKSPHYSMF
jgi:putative phosphoesterase